MKLYLSRLIVNIGGDPNRPRPGRRWIANPYRVHQRLSMAFEDPPHISDHKDHCHAPRGEEWSILFRIEGTPRNRILVQSLHPPDWGRAFGNAEFLLAAPPAVKTFEPAFREGQRFRFLLRANPTVKRKREASKKGARIALRDAEACEAWFRRKADQCGFRSIGPLRMAEKRPQVSRRSRMLDPQKHIHYAVEFSGLLEVTDPDLLRKALVRGIGPAKAYGFGLLSLARAVP